MFHDFVTQLFVVKQDMILSYNFRQTDGAGNVRAPSIPAGPRDNILLSALATPSIMREWSALTPVTAHRACAASLSLQSREKGHVKGNSAKPNLNM